MKQVFLGISLDITVSLTISHAGQVIMGEPPAEYKAAVHQVLLFGASRKFKDREVRGVFLFNILEGYRKSHALWIIPSV